jgi:hypothetical protein
MKDSPIHSLTAHLRQPRSRLLLLVPLGICLENVISSMGQSWDLPITNLLIPHCQLLLDNLEILWGYPCILGRRGMSDVGYIEMCIFKLESPPLAPRPCTRPYQE